MKRQRIHENPMRQAQHLKAEDLSVEHQMKTPTSTAA
jgi:hypothetical protein